MSSGLITGFLGRFGFGFVCVECVIDLNADGNEWRWIWKCCIFGAFVHLSKAYIYHVSGSHNIIFFLSFHVKNKT